MSNRLHNTYILITHEMTGFQIFLKFFPRNTENPFLFQFKKKSLHKKSVKNFSLLRQYGKLVWKIMIKRGLITDFFDRLRFKHPQLETTRPMHPRPVVDRIFHNNVKFQVSQRNFSNLQFLTNINDSYLSKNIRSQLSHYP